VRANAMGAVLTHANALKKKLEGAYIERIRARDDAGARTVVDAAQQLFGPDDELYRALRTVEERIERFTAAIERDDLAGIEAVMQAVDQSGMMREQLRARMIDGVHEYVRRLLDRKQPVRALEILSALDLSLRTPSTSELLQRTLTALAADNTAAFLAPRPRRFITLLARLDPSMRDWVAQLLEDKIRDDLKRAGTNEGEALFELLLAVRADPSARNDALRIEQVLTYLANDKNDAAQQRLAEIRSGLRFDQYVTLMQAGMYGRWWIVIVAAMIPLVVGLLLLARRWRGLGDIRIAEAKEVRRKSTQHVSAAESAPRFTVLKRQTAINPYLDEYSRCLSIFELRPDSSLQLIKNTYRQAVKKFHPDRQTQEGNEVSTQFIEMTQTYHRILELRRKMGLPDD
jgi:hypothetical protein